MENTSTGFLADHEDMIFTVTQVNKHLRHVVEANIPHLMVVGEVTNWVTHSSGHCYFSVKDEGSTLRCVMFRHVAEARAFTPKDGDEVILMGKLTVFERGGAYQLNVLRLHQSGLGELRQRFEALKAKLHAEGLFAPERKRKLPPFPETIGIVTSLTGAAFQDIRSVLERRFPVTVYLYPASVQGANAAGEIIAGLRYFNDVLPVDVMIVGRGGGSQEDLFVFNDENLARAIANSHVPVISAVGHEIDFTIADFAADLRAPTPSAAAELVVPDKADVLAMFQAMGTNLKLLTRDLLSTHRRRLQSFQFHLRDHHPESVLREMQQRLDEAVSALSIVPATVGRLSEGIEVLSDRLNMGTRYSLHRYAGRAVSQLNHLSGRLERSVSDKIANSKHRLQAANDRLSMLSPMEAMKRGYSLVRLEGMILRSVEPLKPGDKIELLLSDGSVDCRVETKSDSHFLTESGCDTTKLHG